MFTNSVIISNDVVENKEIDNASTSSENPVETLNDTHGEKTIDVIVQNSCVNNLESLMLEWKLSNILPRLTGNVHFAFMWLFCATS